MTLTLPSLLDDMVAALNAHDADAFLVCFAAEPIVRDEGKVHYGEAAVRAWFEDVVLRYRPAFEVTELGYADGEPVLTGAVSGAFDDSPIRLRFFCGVEDGKIVALKIAPGEFFVDGVSSPRELRHTQAKARGVGAPRLQKGGANGGAYPGGWRGRWATRGR